MRSEYILGKLAVLFTFLVSVIVTGPYVKWRKRGGAAHPAPAAQA